MRQWTVTLIFSCLFFLCSIAQCKDARQENDRLEEKPYTQILPATSITFEMQPIPAGEFMMGSGNGEKGHQPDEGPRVRVQVDAFWMGKYAVTGPEYEAFYNSSFRLLNTDRSQFPKDQWADAVTYPTPIYGIAIGPSLDRMGRGAGYPAVGMSQYSARQYTKWLSRKTGRFYRLPTEVEWEYACRAGTTTAYHYGDDAGELAKHAWFVDNSNLKDGDPAYRKVGQKPANAWGLFDMHGNVGQWCIDQYDAHWYAQFAEKGARWKDAINWPTKRYPIVVRGGGYESEAVECRSASRLHSTRDFNNRDAQLPPSAHWESNALWVGFRLVSPVKEPTAAEMQRFWDDPDPLTKMTVREQSREIHEIIKPSTKPRHD